MHKIMMINMEIKFQEVTKHLSDQPFFMLPKTIRNTAVVAANDAQCHLKCWSLAQRSHTRNTDVQYKSQEIEDVDGVLADLEIFNMVKNVLSLRPDAVFSLNELNFT